MKTFVFLTATIILSCVFLLSPASYAMKTDKFSTFEKILSFQGDFEIMDEITLKPGEERYLLTYAYKPVRIDFKTALSNLKKVKNSGIGLKKASNVKYYIKDPTNASMEVLPEDGIVKVAVKNFESFAITLKVYKVTESS